jgi:hypothetical protein
VKPGHGKAALLAAALGAVALGAGALTPAVASGAAPRVTLPQAAPKVPADVRQLGPAPAGQVLNLGVVLAGQNPTGLAQAVEAVSTPGSPDYRHYLTAAQYAAEFGPSPAEVAQVSSVLRGEGLTVGSPAAGSTLLPVSGQAGVVSTALGTPLETVQAPNQARVLVNTAPPQIPASLAGAVTGVVGLDGLFKEHSMLLHGNGNGNGNGNANPPPAPSSPTAGSRSNAIAHGTPQACAGAADTALSHPGSYTSTQLAGVFGQDQLLNQGRMGLGQTIAVVEFEQYLSSDVASFQSCYALSNQINNVSVDGGPGGPSAGGGEAALDIELASFGAPSASLAVYEAPNGSDVAAADLFNRIAVDDSAQVVTTSWGDCEASIQSTDAAFLQTEKGIFDRMSLQGQTIVAASGDAGSEDCFPDPNLHNSTSLAVDDPGSQPDVVSAGGTSLPSASASSQVVWNDCMGQAISCANSSLGGSGRGAGGGGSSTVWPRPSYQPAFLGAHRAVPDIAYPGNPTAGGVVVVFQGVWNAFGGTSVAAPTNAGLFADTNQGCFNRLGRVGPALWAAGLPLGNTNFTDITSGNNDFTFTNGGNFPAVVGPDMASGLGTPVDQNLSLALQGADGCPSVASVSPNTGPVAGSGPITISGGGFANATSVTFGSVGAGQILAQSQTAITVVPPNASGPMCVDVRVANSQGVSATSAADHYGFGGDLNCGQGYRFAASDGGVFDFGDASFWGSTGSIRLNQPVVGMGVTPSTNGYWLVASDGGIFSFGDAGFFGSMGGQHLNKPIVGMASTPDGRGYWLVASDGGIFSFGTARFFGSTGSLRLNKPVVGMAPTPDGAGYWLVASDGGIFSYGDASFHGSTGSLVLNSPVVGMASGPGGGGYWLVGADGGIFDYGNAGFFGSAGSLRLNKPVVGMAASPDAGGYWLVASDGGIFNYGDAHFYGSTGSLVLNKPIVGMSST